MAREILKSGDVVLPAPVSISVADEIIWTSDTGRTLAGTMIGDVIAEKKTVGLKWGYLLESEVTLIKSRLIAGFFPLSFRDDGVFLTIDAYRGTLSKEAAGWIGSDYWYKSVSVDAIQR